MNAKLRVLVFLLATLASFVAVANVAVFHWAIFVALMLPWGLMTSRLFDWVKS